MKIRNGFVSNSSSSSFCIYGDAVEDVESLIRKNDLFTAFDFTDIENESDKAEIIQNSSKILNCYTDEDGITFIGRNPETIKDDETGAQFKKTVEDEFNRIFDTNKHKFSLQWITQEIYS